MRWWGSCRPEQPCNAAEARAAPGWHNPHNPSTRREAPPCTLLHEPPRSLTPSVPAAIVMARLLAARCAWPPRTRMTCVVWMLAMVAAATSSTRVVLDELEGDGEAEVEHLLPGTLPVSCSGCEPRAARRARADSMLTERNALRRVRPDGTPKPVSLVCHDPSPTLWTLYIFAARFREGGARGQGVCWRGAHRFSVDSCRTTSRGAVVKPVRLTTSCRRARRHRIRFAVVDTTSHTGWLEEMFARDAFPALGLFVEGRKAQPIWLPGRPRVCDVTFLGMAWNVGCCGSQLHVLPRLAFTGGAEVQTTGGVHHGGVEGVVSPASW